MITVQIHLKSGATVAVNYVNAITVFYSNGVKTYQPDDFNSIPVKDQASYVFVSDQETISILGSEISYLCYVKI